jgi:acetolactate synthase-1/2/3 large subunit
MIGAELIVKALERQGVGTVFGLPGHLECLFGALGQSDIRLINMRHEAAVVMAADGYARIRRGIGVACVTAGPGLANALGGLASAFDACSPVLVLSGRNPFVMDDTAALQEMDHTRAARWTTKWARTVHDPSRLGEYIDMACRVALSGRPGPVLLEVPRDGAEGEVDAGAAPHAMAPLVRAERPLADRRAVQRAAAVLAQAERPLIIAGNGAYWGGAGPGLAKLARDFRIPVMTKGLARGLVEEDMETGFGWPLGHLAARHADVVMVVGARLGHPIGYGAPPLYKDDARFIQVDVEGSEIGRNRYVEAPVVGDCGPALEALTEELAGRHNQPGDPAWVAAALAERLTRLDDLGREDDGMVHPLRMARELQARLPDDAIVVGDGANCLNWYKAVIAIKQAPGWMDQDPFGSMGVGLPMALGAVAAQAESDAPRPVFLATGDGALGQYLGELATVSLHGLPLFMMVANDGAWGASRNIALNLFGGTHGVEMAQSRYDLVAQGLECHGELAEAPDQVGPAFDRALKAVRGGNPALVNVVVDPDSGLSRRDPLLQMVTFNYDWFATKQQRKKK